MHSGKKKKMLPWSGCARMECLAPRVRPGRAEAASERSSLTAIRHACTTEQQLWDVGLTDALTRHRSPWPLHPVASCNTRANRPAREKTPAKKSPRAGLKRPHVAGWHVSTAVFKSCLDAPAGERPGGRRGRLMMPPGITAGPGGGTRHRSPRATATRKCLLTARASRPGPVSPSCNFLPAMRLRHAMPGGIAVALAQRSGTTGCRTWPPCAPPSTGLPPAPGLPCACCGSGQRPSPAVVAPRSQSPRAGG